MKVLGVIPARYASTRFPGKPLAPLLGQPMLHWVLEGCREAKRLDGLLVATDDERIARVAREAGAEAAMTDPALPSGTDRIWAAVRDRDVDLIVNIQGDEPLMSGALIDGLVEAFAGPNPPEMATLAHPISDEDLGSLNAVKVLVNAQSDAIYFSRFPIPHSRHDAKSLGAGCLKHLGIYAYSKKFLKRFCETPPALIENAEALEQLRALYLGARIRVVPVAAGLRGVDTPEDARAVEDILRRKHGPL